MRFTSVDIESNQPSGKIIQFSAVVFDTDMGKIAHYTEYVDPGEAINWHEVLNTGQTLEQLLAKDFRRMSSLFARPSVEVMQDFWKWHKQQQAGKKFIQWGRGDMAQVIAESQGCGYPSHLRVLDLKQVYQFLFQPSARLQAQSGLSTACVQLGIDPPDPAHDAYHDAEATGRVMLKMFSQIASLNTLLRSLT
jgi:DNA polymerase III epsilon subunit-like protein